MLSCDKTLVPVVDVDDVSSSVSRFIVVASVEKNPNIQYRQIIYYIVLEPVILKPNFKPT